MLDHLKMNLLNMQIDITKKNDDKETGGENPTTPPTGGGENPTTPPTGNGENPTPPTEEGNNGNEPKQDGNNTDSGQTTTDDQNTKETTTTVSENKEAEKDERDLPKTGASIASTIGAGLAFVGADYLCYLEERKRIDSREYKRITDLVILLLYYETGTAFSFSMKDRIQ